jgi:uncharacterized protein YndB with AHSA1/START domain
MISIRKELLVSTSQETAFRVFSQQMDAWWPRSHHVGKTPMVAMVLEPKAKGRWYSTHQGGEVCEVGRVESFEPHSRLLLIWQLDGEFKFNAELRTEVEVRFVAQGAEQTLVMFEHRDLERLGKSVDSMNNGWGMILELFAKVAKDGKLAGDDLKMYQRTSIDG